MPAQFVKELRARRHPPGRAPRWGGGHGRDLQLPTEARCQETSRSSLRFIYCAAHQGQSRCLCGRVSERDRERERGAWLRQTERERGAERGEQLSDIVNLHLGVESTCQHHSPPTMTTPQPPAPHTPPPLPDLCHLYSLIWSVQLCCRFTSAGTRLCPKLSYNHWVCIVSKYQIKFL